MRTVRMLVLSPLVTAARASASSAPAFSRSSRSNPEPTMHGPSHSLRRRKALADLSRMATEWPSALSEMARPDPTRPHPTTMTCTPQCNTPRRVLQRRTATSTSTSGECFYCVAVATPITAGTERATPPPVPLPGTSADSIPETRRYRLKNKLLGAPLVTEQLASERLNKVIALGVLAPDCISSSAYGTEEMLTQLVPYVGLAAFALVVPITIAILAVLFFVTLSYLEVIQLYTKAGGSYVVARDNFGPRIAQIAAVALLIDYTVTVAVQTSAGTAALTSAVPALANPFDTIAITVGVVLVLLYGILRGIREAGSYFAILTYFFIFCLATVIIVGYVKEALGQLHQIPLPAHDKIFG